MCSKIFCCEDCCADHIRKKHPTSREPKCPLCRSERLMVKNFENNVILLCHIVFNHLPLHCRYCGKEFKNNNDLQCIGTCSRRAIVKNVTEVSYSFLSPDALSSLNKTPSERLSIKIKDFSITGGYNENFINFSSPPERMRNTSTPMNNNLAGYCKTSFGFKTPRSPNVSIKTPKTANSIANDLLRKQFLLNRQNGSVTSATVYKDTESSTSDLKFYSVSSISRSALGGTPLRSILCNKSTSSENSDQEYSRTTGRRLGSMKEINEEMGIEEIARIDMDLMDSGKSVLAPLNVGQPKEQKDSAKRVRFSDEFEAKSEAEISTASYFDATDNDEFFEARQSFSDSPVAVETVSNLQENEEEKSATKLADSCDLSNRENEENCEKEKTENLVDTQILDFGDNDRLGNLLSSSSSVTPSTSRVVMMVVVEKNGRVDTNDLRSLIDSSLKKVEGLSKPISPIRLHMELPRSTQNNASTENSVVSVDSYLTFSTLDCSSKPDLTLNIPERRQPEIDNAGATTGGIFSVMAQAMKTAFRNFSGEFFLQHSKQKFN